MQILEGNFSDPNASGLKPDFTSFPSLYYQRPAQSLWTWDILNQGWVQVSLGGGATGPQGPTGATGPAAVDTHSTLAYAATTDIDLDSAATFRTVTLAGNITFTTSNRAAARSRTIRIIGDGSSRTLTFPAGWKFVGGTAPTALASSKVGVLAITAFGTADTDIVAAYAVES